MTGDTVRLDLHEVETEAATIRTLVQELQQHAATLTAAVRRTPRAAYGTDRLGAALLGSHSGAGGLAEHQRQALVGIHRFLADSAAMADSLLLMCRRHRAADLTQAADLGRASEGAPQHLPSA
ncbi:hypothetical protein ACWGB8_11940 [Kitasatospora sp. NPDC054939]